MKFKKKKELRVSTAEQSKQKKETVKYNTGIILNYLVRGEQRKRMKKKVKKACTNHGTLFFKSTSNWYARRRREGEGGRKLI